MDIFWNHGTGDCRIFPCQNSGPRLSTGFKWPLAEEAVGISAAIQSLRLASLLCPVMLVTEWGLRGGG